MAFQSASLLLTNVQSLITFFFYINTSRRLFAIEYDQAKFFNNFYKHLYTINNILFLIGRRFGTTTPAIDPIWIAQKTYDEEVNTILEIPFVIVTPTSSNPPETGHSCKKNEETKWVPTFPNVRQHFFF